MIFCVYTNYFCKFENFNAKRERKLHSKISKNTVNTHENGNKWKNRQSGMVIAINNGIKS